MTQSRDELRTRVDNAILLARYANLKSTPILEAYRDALKSEDLFIFCLMRHFTNELCEFVENRVHLDA